MTIKLLQVNTWQMLQDNIVRKCIFRQDPPPPKMGPGQSENYFYTAKGTVNILMRKSSEKKKIFRKYTTDKRVIHE